MESETHDHVAEKRTEATNAIIDSASGSKLIVAGPGTGKTFTFQRALEQCGGRGLALTFIRNLVADLRAELEAFADVYTFHGFCKYQLHRHPADGLETGWHYYPPLLDLIAYDLALLGTGWSKDDLTRALHTLDESGGLIGEALRLGTYYNAVSHTDVVYRVLRHFEEHDDEIPTFPLIVVDEYQDFSEMETAFIQLLARRSDVLIAGDDDQALYGFKGAEPRFIRELAEGGAFERFTLPYCSRCTDVVVAAVNDVLAAAVGNGNLDGRLEKEFECYVPDKAVDSQAHPHIIHAVCSVQSRKAPYVGRYIVEQIDSISTADIEESRGGGYPTVLVVGPNPFLDAAFETITESFPQAKLRKSERLEIEVLEGYRLLAKDERSRLGWRIVLACDGVDGSDDVLAEVTRDEVELVDELPDSYRDRHLALARLVARLLNDGDLEQEELGQLAAATQLELDGLVQALGLAEKRESENDAGDALGDDSESGGDPAQADQEPSIICTSLTGSKGLSAGYVFIVGFNNGHFPRDPAAITDQEVCQLLVGLSRTRKACHLVSVRHYGPGWLEASSFARWVSQHLRHVDVDKAYLDGP
jgi:superfamily I DNA/RNA helicase